MGLDTIEGLTLTLRVSPGPSSSHSASSLRSWHQPRDFCHLIGFTSSSLQMLKTMLTKQTPATSSPANLVTLCPLACSFSQQFPVSGSCLALFAQSQASSLKAHLRQCNELQDCDPKGPGSNPSTATQGAVITNL